MTWSTAARPRAKSALTIPLAALLALAVGVLTFLVPGLVAPAAAATGSITDLTITKVSDGEGSSLDTDSQNGLTATNTPVVYRWNFKSTGVEDGVFVQTLPEGWEWDQDTFVPVAGPTPYSVNYEFADDGRTVTAMVTTPAGTATNVELGDFVAYPRPSAVPDSIYTAVLEVTDGNGTRTVDVGAEGTTQVKSEARYEVSKALGRGRSNRDTTFDFGDGHGTEDAQYNEYNLLVSVPTEGEPERGTAEFDVPNPLVLSDTLELGDLTTYGTRISRASAGYDATLTGTAPNLSIEITRKDGRDITWEDLKGIYDEVTGKYSPLQIELQVYVPDHDLSAWNGTSKSVTNSLSANLPAVEVNPNNNSATNGLTQERPSSGQGQDAGKVLVTTTDPYAEPTLGQNVGTSRTWTTAPGGEGGSIGAGAVMYARTHYRVQRAPDGEPVANPGLVLYDFWNPSAQQLISSDVGPQYYVGNGAGASEPAGNYRVEYTTDYDPSAAPSSSPATDYAWAELTNAVDTTTISGLRLVYLANSETWMPAKGSNDYLMFIPAFEVVGKGGDEVKDTFLAYTNSGQVVDPVERRTHVNSVVVTLDKSATKSVSSGERITYTLDPTFAPAPGSTEAPVTGLSITDTLPAGLSAIDTSALADGWEVTQSGDIDSGYTLVFTYTAAITNAEDPPSIVFTALTDIESPSDGRYVNTAIITSDGTPQTVEQRTAQATTAINQTRASAISKVVDGPSQIEVDNTDLTWRVSWFNFLEDPIGATEIYDVLPYNGDANGTTSDATLEFSGATLWGDASGDGSVIWVTTDAADTVAADVRSGSITWTDLSALPAADLASVTAIKVTVPEIPFGYNGGISLTMTQDGAVGGDTFQNSSQRFSVPAGGGEMTNAGATSPVGFNVVAYELNGTVWWDANADGLRQDGEALVEGAVITAVNTDTSASYEATTDASGAWIIENLPSGTYNLTIDNGALGAALTAQDSGDDAIDSDFGADPIAVTLGAASGAVESATRDAGLLQGELAIEKYVAADASSDDFIEADAADAAGSYVYGESIRWRIVVSNPGQSTVSNVVVKDAIATMTSTDDTCVALASDDGFAIANLGAGEEVTIDCAATATESLENTASAEAPGLDAISDPAFITVRTNRDIAVTKQVESAPGSGEWVESADRTWGEDVAWKIVVTNTGDVPLTNVRVGDVIADGDGEPTDQVLDLTDGASAECTALADAAAYGPDGSGGWAIGDLAAGDSAEITCTSRATESLTNLASAVGEFTPASGGDTEVLSATDTAAVTVAANPAIVVAKEVVSVEGGDVWGEEASRVQGEVVSWRVTVSNTGDVPLSNVRIADVIDGATDSSIRLADEPSAECVALADPAAYGTGGSGGWIVGDLPVGGTATIECASVAESSLTNLAWATGDFTQAPDIDPVVVEAADTASVVVASTPGVAVSKEVLASEGSDSWGESAERRFGELVTWRITVSNTGDVPLTGVRVADVIADAPGESLFLNEGSSAECVALADPAAYGASGSGGWIVGDLEVGGSATIECTSVALASFTNVAWVTGTFAPAYDLPSQVVEAEDTASVSASSTVVVDPPGTCDNNDGVMPTAGNDESAAFYRFASKNRVLTALFAAKNTSGWCDTAILASSVDYADALAAAPLADALDAPILLANADGSLDPQVQEYLASEFDFVVIASGPGVIPESVRNSLNDALTATDVDNTYGGVHTARVAGVNRYETAATLAVATLVAEGGKDDWTSGAQFILADGQNFPDALAAGPAAAAATNGVILLTAGDSGVPSFTSMFLPGQSISFSGATLAYLPGWIPGWPTTTFDWSAIGNFDHQTITVVGGAAKAAAEAGMLGNITEPVEYDDALVGADRYETATLVATKYFGSEPTYYTLASGEDFPDAVVAGGWAANADGPLVLTRNAALPQVTMDYLVDIADNGDAFVVFGGTGSVSRNVSDQLEDTFIW